MKIKLLLLLLMFPFAAFAQEADYVKEMENSSLQIRQKPFSESLLANFLRPVDIKEDTVYAILYSPASCFRCEAAIPAFFKELKDNNPKNKMLLISAYPDSIVAASYNKKNDYKADYYLYDTQLDYKKYSVLIR